MDKVLIVLSGTSGGVSIISHASIIGIPVGIISSSSTLVFYLTTGIIKKVFKRNKKKEEKTVKLLCLLRIN